VALSDFWLGAEMIRALALVAGLATALAGACDAQEDPRRAKICRPGYSASLRLAEGPYRAMRGAAFARAGIPVSQQCHKDDPRPDCYILDHILPLELCTLGISGCNNPSNMQVQRRLDAEEKDQTENLERLRYCEGAETLPEAASHFHRSVP
jgi:hypothetical protein